MLTIIWKNKPANHDTRMVTQVWFTMSPQNRSVSTINYTTVHDNHVFSASAKDVQSIVSEETYLQTRRAS